MEVWQDKIKGGWDYRFEYQGITYTEKGFKSKLDCESTGAVKEMQVIMGQEFIPESRESKEKLLFEDPNNYLPGKPIKKPDNSSEKKLTSEKVTPKVIGKVTPKNKHDTPTSQTFEEGSNLKSNTQKHRKSDTQNEEPILNEGWVPLFRKSVKSQVFQNEGLWKHWTWCMMKAGHAEQWVPIKTGKGITEIHLLPGQFIFGRKTAAKELKMKPTTVRNRMLKLKNMRNLDTQSGTHYSVVTLNTWDFYRELMKEGHPKRTTTGQPKDTYKNDKKEKNNIYSQNFLNYWKAYPNRAAKKKAFEAWQKLEKREDMETLLPTLLDAIEKQKQAKKIKKANGEFVSEWPNPATWLNGRRWEDEIEIKKRWDHATG